MFPSEESMRNYRPRRRVCRSRFEYLLWGFILLSCNRTDEPGEGKGADGNGDEVVLSELFATAMPDGVNIGGIASRDATTFLLWDDARVFLWNRPEGTLTQLGPGSITRPVGGTISGPDRRILVLDRDSARVHEFRHDGQYTGGLPLNIRRRIDGVSWTECGLVVVSSTAASESSSEVSLVDPHGEIVWTRQVPDLFSQTSGIARVDRSTRGVTLSEVLPPHRFTTLNCQGEVVSASEGPGPLDLLEEQQWATVATLDLGTHMLQTISDVRSDRRILALFNPSGQILRKREIDIPMAFFAVTDRQKDLLAVRDLGQLEVAAYSWEPSRTPQQTAERD
jgi:hypothetical protein